MPYHPEPVTSYLPRSSFLQGPHLGGKESNEFFFFSTDEKPVYLGPVAFTVIVYKL